MALSDASSQTYIKNELTAAFGAPADPSRNDAFTLALAKAINKILKDDAIITGSATVSSGSSAGSHPVTGTVS